MIKTHVYFYFLIDNIKTELLNSESYNFSFSTYIFIGKNYSKHRNLYANICVNEWWNIFFWVMFFLKWNICLSCSHVSSISFIFNTICIMFSNVLKTQRVHSIQREKKKAWYLHLSFHSVWLSGRLFEKKIAS